MNQTLTPYRFLSKAIGLTVLSAVLCLSAAQKASAQAPINITGTVFDDRGGATDNIINGVGINNLGAPGNQQLYVYLTVAVGGGSSQITAKAVVAGDGTYTLAGLTNTNYAILLSTSNVAVGTFDPAVAFPGTWVATAEGFAPGGGGAVNADFTFTFTSAGTQAGQQPILFGINKRPAGNSYVVASPMLDGPNGGRMVVPAAAITGSDLEDGTYPTGLTGRTVDLSGPVNADLYYMNAKLNFNGGTIRIQNFDVNQLTVDGNFGATTAQFSYAPVDSAGFNAFQASSVFYPVVLLVKLTRFDVVRTGTGSSRIQWETASELNHDYFDVQRSTDSRSFSSIGKVSSKSGGTSTVATSYEMDDNALPAAAAVYYRLRMVDFNGKEQYSNTIRIAGGVSSQVSAFPNPATREINFDLSNFTGTSRISILDGSGKVVASYDAEGGRIASVSLGNLNAGRYFYQIANGQSNAVTSSFVVIR